jgi:predicted transcriptional regulator
MEMLDALEAFASLSQETRLRIFKLLVEYGRDGLIPGKIASELKIPNNTLSFHLSHMSKAKLVNSTKEGRSITYYANCDLMDGLIGFIQANCCAREKKSKSRSQPCNDRKC